MGERCLTQILLRLRLPCATLRVHGSCGSRRVRKTFDGLDGIAGLFSSVYLGYGSDPRCAHRLINRNPRCWGQAVHGEFPPLQITWTAPFGLEYAIVANSDCRGRISSASNRRRNFSCWVNPALFISQKVLILRDEGRCGGTLVAMMQGKNI